MADSLLQNLMHRRVPQLVGMYVAATWLVIELGDWTTERFNLPEAVTTYVFIAMLAMLPAVVVFSYNHGAPGKDRWTTADKLIVPLNVLATLGILYFVSPSLNVEAATETIQIADETGVIQEFEVARSGYHKDVLAFFWQNDTANSDLDWLSYGLPLMLAHDLNRVSPVITVNTPFDSYLVRNELRSRGYPSFLDEPQALRVEIARDRRSAALIVGSFDEIDGKISIQATLLDAATGNEIGSQSVTGDDWLDAIDGVTSAVLTDLDVSPSDNQSDDPVSQHFSDSLEAIEHFTKGQLALDVNNDYAQGIAEFRSALEIDPGFAEASGDLSRSLYLSNDIESARNAAEEALRNDYRLSVTSSFLLKANRYIYAGDYDRGERVFEIWTQVQPNSTAAFGAMAQFYRMRGTTESLEMADNAYDRLLELDPQDISILRQKANLEQQRGNFDAASDYLNDFLQQEPDNGDAHRQLAGVYQALGDLDAAQVSLEDAAILSDNPLESEIGLARLEARAGKYDAASRRLAGQHGPGLSPPQRLQLIAAETEIAAVRGQIEDALTMYDEISDIAKEFMPPMMQLIGIENEKTTLLLQLGRIDEALAKADEITAQLQPPTDAVMNFTYTSIYDVSGDRDAYRDIVVRMETLEGQIAPVFRPFIEMQRARVAIWDEDFDKAVGHIDIAAELLGQSVIQSFQDNLSFSILHIMLAELYLDANEVGKARNRTEEILRIFPASGHAKLVLAKVQLAEGDDLAARDALMEALEIWADADAEFILSVDANELLESI